MNFSRLLCSVALLLNTSLALAQGFKISDIRINGLQRVSAGSVFGALPLNVGDEADDRRLVDSTRALFKTGYFQDIHLSREGDVLVINVVEDGIVFLGMKPADFRISLEPCHLLAGIIA